MPIYEGSRALRNDEWILLQIKEGPCSAGCEYCYENAQIRTILGAAQTAGVVEAGPLNELSTLQLAQLSNKYRDRVGIEMSLDQVESIFTLLRQAGFARAGLIGSEPSTHRQFNAILDSALANNMELLVYTAGLTPRTMQHPAIKFVVLHLDYGWMGIDERTRRLEAGILPSPSYMKDIEILLQAEKEIHLRVNFSSSELTETNLVYNFFSQIHPNLLKQTCLKYSFNTRVSGDASVAYETPDTLRSKAHVLREFIDRFVATFPDVKLLSERPLFPCSFDKMTWNTYVQRGGFLSSCDMEYTFYPNEGLALCPPSRNLVAPKSPSNPTELREQLLELRLYLEAMYKIPSFDCCESCELRKDLSCQGGCLGYKSGRAQSFGDKNVHRRLIPVSALARSTTS